MNFARTELRACSWTPLKVHTENPSRAPVTSNAPCPHSIMATGPLGAYVDATSKDSTGALPNGPTRGQFDPPTSGANNTRREPYGEPDRDSQGSLQVISRVGARDQLSRLHNLSCSDLPPTQVGVDPLQANDKPYDAQSRLQVISLVGARDQLSRLHNLSCRGTKPLQVISLSCRGTKPLQVVSR